MKDDCGRFLNYNTKLLLKADTLTSALLQIDSGYKQN
jgi:hypothetical protein